MTDIFADRKWLGLVDKMHKRCREIYGRSQVELPRVGSPIREETLATIEHRDWIPEQMLAFAREIDGFRLIWTPSDGRQFDKGNVNILPLEKIYGDWEGTVYFDGDDEGSQTRNFKIVDFFADEACVGIFHDERRSPELHYFNLEDFTSLGVDLNGYLQLLTQTLGYHYWQRLLRELASSTVRPFRPQWPQSQQTLADLETVVPGFNLDAFVQLYDEVRLRA